MSEIITLPTPAEIDDRIRDCREELAALKKLRTLAKTTQKADLARARRQAHSHEQSAGSGPGASTNA